MNMPKRASCHHFIRRTRSASSVSEAACGPKDGASGCPSAAAAVEEAPSARSEALVPNSQSRRGIRFGPMTSASSNMGRNEPPFAARSSGASRRMIVSSQSLFKLEYFFHQQPFFSWLVLRKRRLKFPHQLFPLAYLRIFTILFHIRIEGKSLVHLHDHEHARAEQIDLHVFDSGVLDALRDLRPDFLVVAPILRD